MSIDLDAGRRLLLSGGGQGWLWGVAGVVALALVLFLYRYERKLVTRRTGLTLLALRLAAAGALVLALFDPITRVTYREVVRGRVVLGVDLSESMATVEDGRSRREVARGLLAGDWVKGIEQAHDVRALGFARGATAGTPATLAEALARPSKVDDPSAAATDWEPVLAEALKEEGAPVVGVVLLTDGRRNGAGDLGAMADRLAARGIPIYPVLIGSTALPRDAAVAAVKAPEGVYKGDTARVEVTVKVDAPAGTEVPVTLDRPGASPLKKTVRAQADGGRPVVTFAVPMEVAGPQALTVAVGPLADDIRADNDRRSFTVQVAEDKARVLLIAGEAGWEFQYLRNALARDPRVAVESVVFRQPTSAAAAGPAYAKVLPAQGENDPLGDFDAVILGDADPADLPAEAWARLEAFVAERGGTLVVGAGPRSLGASSTNEVLSKLLPVVEPRLVPVGPSKVDPRRPGLPPGMAILPAQATSAEQWPMLQFAAEPSASAAAWAGLPALPWVSSGRAKPSATVLATAGGPDEAAMAAMPYGLGKVLWVGTDGTWRWRYRVGDAYHHRFWGQVVRWSARGKLSAGNRLVRFGPERGKVAEGEPVAIRARFAEAVPGVDAGLLVAAKVYRAPAQAGDPPSGEPLAVVPLRPRAGEPRGFEGMVPALPMGAYVVSLEAPQLASAMAAEVGVAPTASLEVAGRETSERVELAASREPLERLAGATGGRVFAAADAGDLPALLRGKTIRRERAEESALWDRPLALSLFLAVLALEWVLRKRAGLP